MNVPIRMLGIATSIFWIILIGYFASAAYSLKDLNLNFGEPQFTTTEANDMLFNLPIYVDNQGYYSLKGFNLTTVFSNAEGAELTNDSTFVPVIPQGEKTTILHNATISLRSLTEMEQYLFNDTSLNCEVVAELNFAELLPIQLTMDVPFPWGAPLYGFSLGEPSIRNLDISQVGVSVPLSFENHATFALVGNVRVELCDDADSVLAESQIPLDVAAQTEFYETLRFNVPFDATSQPAALKGHFNVYFSTSMFDYGPRVIPYG